MERVIVWQRGCPLSEPSRDALALGVALRSLARDRFTALGAEIVAELGATLVVSLELAHLTRAIELSINVLREAEREGGGVPLSTAVCVGVVELDLELGAHVGDAIDRAQALANAGQPYEVLLDTAAARATAGAFLFARELALAPGVDAVGLDRSFPRRSDCQRSIAHLARPAFRAQSSLQFETLRRVASSGGQHRVLLVGAHGLGLSQWIERIVEENKPSLWLDVRALGASIAPLSGLMHALARVPRESAPEAILSRADEADAHARATLETIRAGGAVARRDAVLALRQYIGRASERGARAIVSVDPMPLIDPSTVGVVAESAREGGPSGLVIMRLLLDSKPPEAFARGGGLCELRARGLTRDEARALAAGMLRCEGSDDMARRAAAMAGPPPVAVAEAVRALVGSGDVVFASGAFRWRRGPAGRLNTLGLEALFEERLDALAAPLRRALEIVATVPDPDDAALVRALSERDGFVPETWERALEELDSFGFLHVRAETIALSAALRELVQRSLSPARTQDLHGTLVDVLGARTGPEAEFARATHAHYLARAGRCEEAAQIFLDVAQRAAELGFVRSSVRLAAAAVESDTSETSRARAAELVDLINRRQQARVSTPGKDMPEGRREVSGVISLEAEQRAVHALLGRDFEEVERAIELLVAAGRNAASIDRLRTVTLLAKGDSTGALALLERLRARPGSSPRDGSRLALTSALVAIAGADYEGAVRAALSTLARSRASDDGDGERAALGVLAMCYRGLGRSDDADRLIQAAHARA